MAYATDTLAGTAQPSPVLGQLKFASERVANVASRVDQFIERFHGPQPSAGAAGGPDKPPQNYRNDIESLFAQIDRLEAVVGALDGIG